ncbi:MAG: mandelate racemase/muconate lactonizing enzyme family protein [Acidobacteriia bacterium]|nr:mandelate racemase/muconate lactonizing enzyme family protein [Terriglobia bacterium]
MKITQIKAIPLVRSLPEPFLGGTYRITSRNTLVTEVHTDTGIVGQVFGGDEDKYQQEIAAVIETRLAPLLIGEDPRDVEKHWERMFRADPGLENRGLHTLDLANKAILMQAISAVDIALWDVIGKTFSTPVYKLLGGYRAKVPVIGIGGYYGKGKGDRELIAEMEGYRRDGLAGVKLKVGRADVQEDVRRVRIVREALGDDFVIACDANQAWTPEQAIRFARLAENLNVRWLEEPVQWYDQLRGLRLVRQKTAIPVVAGQGEISRFGCRDLILNEAVDILNVDVTLSGGITEWRRIAAMAGMFHIGMAHHEEPQVAIHLLASVPHALYVEIFPNPERDPMWFELPLRQPRIKDGFMEVPQTPGLGIDLNPEVIRKYVGTARAV